MCTTLVLLTHGHQSESTLKGVKPLLSFIWQKRTTFNPKPYQQMPANGDSDGLHCPLLSQPGMPADGGDKWP